MENTTFVYGSGIQGSGSTTTFDVLIGLLILTLAIAAAIFHTANLWFIKRLKIFHNAFGWFWASRNVSEGINAIVNIVYVVPLVLLQPANIPVIVSIVPFVIFYICALNGCLMHGVLAANRLLAVFNPVNYHNLFKTSNCVAIIVFAWLSCLVCAPIFIVVPCNLVGFSPSRYEYIFITCSPEVERDYSIVITVANHFCCVLCIGIVIVDCFTLARIIYIRKVLTMDINSANFKRDVRFFKQSTLQNVTMIIGVVLLVRANDRPSPELKNTNVITFTSIMLIHIVNPLSLLIFNPEVRKRLRGMFSARVGATQQSTYSENANVSRRKPTDYSNQF